MRKKKVSRTEFASFCEESSHFFLNEQGGNVEGEDEVGEWRGRRSDILDIREGGDTIRFSRKERGGHPCFSLFGFHQRFKVVERYDLR